MCMQLLCVLDRYLLLYWNIMILPTHSIGDHMRVLGTKDPTGMCCQQGKQNQPFGI